MKEDQKIADLEREVETQKRELQAEREAKDRLAQLQAIDIHSQTDAIEGFFNQVNKLLKGTITKMEMQSEDREALLLDIQGRHVGSLIIFQVND